MRRRLIISAVLAAVVPVSAAVVALTATTAAAAIGGSGPYPADYETSNTLGNHTIYRPQTLPAESLPIFVWGNGGCASNGTGQMDFLREIASHGFLVIANGNPNGSGSTTSQMLTQSIDWAVAENSRQGSKYFGKVDTSKVAVAGWSCGGLEAYAVSNDPRVTTTLIFSSGLLNDADDYQLRRLTRPIRVFADAAERLGADPDAEPLIATGPTEVRTAIVAFNDMQASLRDHVRKQTQTVAAIAHDLRTPLTRLRFRAEQAPEGVRDRMAADIEEMDALIAQAMAYVRGEQPTERRERFDLTDLVRDCAGGFTETGADVVFAGGPGLPVLADPAALRRALANLIGNAVKYGGGARVHTFTEAGQAVVTVEDDGPGLAEEELEAVFEPFHRAERSRNRETGGAGLGLTVARQAARAHGGDVVLSNRRDGGLTARLTLPLAR